VAASASRFGNACGRSRSSADRTPASGIAAFTDRPRTNDVVKNIGGRLPTTLEAFIYRVPEVPRLTTKEKSMGKLEGKNALITGGNGGIGFATAKRFVKEGAYVFITGRRERETAAAVEEIGRNVSGVQGDVSNLGDLDRLFAQIKREKGRLDIVFANAGVVKLAPLGTITEELYDSVFNINVKGVLFTVQKALPLLPDGASIILNASIGGSKGPPALSVTAPPHPTTAATSREQNCLWTAASHKCKPRAQSIDFRSSVTSLASWYARRLNVPEH
jgi:NAD(P)-dependent dehydrogenase (short-subunit alcohol dehydrogenase family)